MLGIAATWNYECILCGINTKIVLIGGFDTASCNVRKLPLE